MKLEFELSEEEMNILNLMIHSYITSQFSDMVGLQNEGYESEAKRTEKHIVRIEDIRRRIVDGVVVEISEQ